MAIMDIILMLNIKVFHNIKINLVIKMITTFIFVLVISLLIYKFFIYPLSGDKASSLASMFGFAATLFAPIAAFLLINNWKEQLKHEKGLESLSNAFNEICSIHFILYYLKKSGKTDEIKENFEKLNNEDFLKYTKETLEYFEEINEKISQHYNNLSTTLSQFSIIKEIDEERFEYILDSYFMIQWNFLTIVKDYINFLMSAKKNGQNLNLLKKNELFIVREIQLKYIKNPEYQKNNDGTYLFMSSLDLALIKRKSLQLLIEERKKL